MLCMVRLTTNNVCAILTENQRSRHDIAPSPLLGQLFLFQTICLSRWHGIILQLGASHLLTFTILQHASRLKGAYLFNNWGCAFGCYIYVKLISTLVLRYPTSSIFVLLWNDCLNEWQMLYTIQSKWSLCPESSTKSFQSMHVYNVSHKLKSFYSCSGLLLIFYICLMDSCRPWLTNRAWHCLVVELRSSSAWTWPEFVC